MVWGPFQLREGTRFSSWDPYSREGTRAGKSAWPWQGARVGGQASVWPWDAPCAGVCAPYHSLAETRADHRRNGGGPAGL